MIMLYKSPLKFRWSKQAQENTYLDGMAIVFYNGNEIVWKLK